MLRPDSFRRMSFSCYGAQEVQAYHLRVWRKKQENQGSPIAQAHIMDSAHKENQESHKGRKEEKGFIHAELHILTGFERGHGRLQMIQNLHCRAVKHP